MQSLIQLLNSVIYRISRCNFQVPYRPGDCCEIKLLPDKTRPYIGLTFTVPGNLARSFGIGFANVTFAHFTIADSVSAPIVASRSERSGGYFLGLQFCHSAY